MTLDDVRQMIVELRFINSILESQRLMESSGIGTLQALHDLIKAADEGMLSWATNFSGYLENLDKKLGNDFTSDVLKKRAAAVLNQHYKEYEEKLCTAFGALSELSTYNKRVNDPKATELINDSVKSFKHALSLLRQGYKAAKQATGEESIKRVITFRGTPIDDEFVSEKTWFTPEWVAAVKKAYPVAKARFA